MNFKTVTITIRYIPKPRKGKAAREAIEDAISRVFEEELGEFVEYADSAVR